ncbi:MAG: hypothetical protein ABIH49_01520 [archaeon]
MTETRDYKETGYKGHPADKTMRYNPNMAGRIFTTLFPGTPEYETEFGKSESSARRSRRTEYSKSETKKPREKEGGLPKRLILVCSLGSFFSGMFFLSKRITGDVVFNMPQNVSNVAGIILFAVGLAGLLFYLKIMKKK